MDGEGRARLWIRPCGQAEPSIQELQHACRFLNAFYVDSRYPVHWPTHYDKDTAVEAKEMTDEIRDYITKSLRA